MFYLWFRLHEIHYRVSIHSFHNFTHETKNVRKQKLYSEIRQKNRIFSIVFFSTKIMEIKLNKMKRITINRSVCSYFRPRSVLFFFIQQIILTVNV